MESHLPSPDELITPPKFVLGVLGGIVPPRVAVTIGNIFVRGIDVDSVTAEFPSCDLAEASVAVVTSSSAGKNGAPISWRSVPVPWPTSDAARRTIVDLDLSGGLLEVTQPQAVPVSDALPRGEATSEGLIQALIDRADAAGFRVSFTLPIVDDALYAVQSTRDSASEAKLWWCDSCAFDLTVVLIDRVWGEQPLLRASFSIAPAVAALYHQLLFSEDGGVALSQVIAVEACSHPWIGVLASGSLSQHAQAEWLKRQKPVTVDDDVVHHLLSTRSQRVMVVPVEVRVARQASRCTSSVSCEALISFGKHDDDEKLKSKVLQMLKQHAPPPPTTTITAVHHGVSDQPPQSAALLDPKAEVNHTAAAGLPIGAQTKLNHVARMAAEEAARLFDVAMRPIEYRLLALSRRLRLLEGIVETTKAGHWE